jgi:hypothetical protein
MTRTARIEGITRVVILLVMGVMAAASFKHIHDLAIANGQPSWIRLAAHSPSDMSGTPSNSS